MGIRLGAVRDAGILLAVVAGLCWFGIITRPIGLLAVIWPANAVLLGLLVRSPRLSAPLPLIGAVAGYMIADLTTGGEFWRTMLLTLGNIAGVGFGVLVYQTLPPIHRSLRAPTSALSLMLAVMAAGAGSGLVGLVAAPVLLGREAIWGFGYWFATEVVNYLVVLPVVLAAPNLKEIRARLASLVAARMRHDDLYPLLGLAISIGVAHSIGGPGSIAFPVPALIWCALRYSLFPTSMLVAFTITWQMYSTTWLLDGGVGDDAVSTAISIRLGLALLALSNFAVATVNASRQELIIALRRAVSLDHLTGAQSRAEFISQGERTVATWPRAALVMADLDHFKRINDEYGHAAGDTALKHFVSTVLEELRPGDSVGRLGGEEFALLLPGADRAGAVRVAERIRLAVESLVVEIDDGRAFSFTVSQGIAASSSRPQQLHELLQLADRQLYLAKSAGRNRVSATQEDSPRMYTPSLEGRWHRVG